MTQEIVFSDDGNLAGGFKGGGGHAAGYTSARRRERPAEMHGEYSSRHGEKHQCVSGYWRFLLRRCPTPDKNAAYATGYLRRGLEVTNVARRAFLLGQSTRDEIITTNRFILILQGELRYTIEGRAMTMRAGTGISRSGLGSPGMVRASRRSVRNCVV